MKNRALKVVLGCFIAASSFAGYAQMSENSAQNVSGKWSGSFDITPPDGALQHDTAWLNLKQDGSTLTGTAGPNEGKQSEIKQGKVNGDDVQFTVPGPGGQILINMEGDHLKGEGSADLPAGKLSVKIDVTRISAISDHAPRSALYDEIAHMDAVLFNAFNARDFNTIKTLFTPDLEFYHDTAGLTSYQQNMDSFKNHFASSTKVGGN